MGYQHADRQHRMVVAAVAPREDVNAVGADVGEGRRFGQTVSHANRVTVIRRKRKAPHWRGDVLDVMYRNEY